MNKKIVVYSLLIFSLLIPSSISSSIKVNALDSSSSDITATLDDPLPMKEWTFMVYLDGDNNLEDAAIDDINEMEAAGGSTADVNIIVLVDLCDGEDSADIEYGVTWNDARYYYIESGTDPDVIESTVISQEGEVNMGRPETLTNFVDFVMTNFPANHYAISLWDHGGGLEGLCWDDTNNHNNIGINELEEALTGYHFDFIGLDACIMGQYEILYELSPFADYVGLSLLNVPNDGFDYENALIQLIADPYMTGDELGVHICTTFIDQYSSAATFAIWNTTDMTNVQTEIEELALVLIDNIDEYADDMGLARELAESDGYPNYGADFYEFVIYLKSSSSVDIVNQATDTQAALEDINIMSYSTFIEHPFGLWIYFPRIPNEDYNLYYANSADVYVNKIPNPYYGLDFVINSSWEEFIYAYRDALPEILYSISDGEELSLVTGTDLYFAVELAAGDKVSVELASDGSGSPDIYLHNAIGQVVDYDDTTTYPKVAEYTVVENCSVYIEIIRVGDYMIYYDLTVDIDSRPYFASFLTTPESPGFGADVDIACEIIDGHGIAEAILSYNTTTGWTNISLTDMGDNIFTASLAIEESVLCLQYRVYATDNIGNYRVSAKQNLIFHEAVLPTIESVKLNPRKPKSGEELVVTIKVSDNSGIDKVIFSYQFEDIWYNKTIYDDDLAEYVFTIQVPENLTSFRYSIYVYDIWGNFVITDDTDVPLDVGLSPIAFISSIAIMAGIYLFRNKRKKK